MLHSFLSTVNCFPFVYFFISLLFTVFIFVSSFRVSFDHILPFLSLPHLKAFFQLKLTFNSQMLLFNSTFFISLSFFLILYSVYIASSLVPNTYAHSNTLSLTPLSLLLPSLFYSSSSYSSLSRLILILLYLIYTQVHTYTHTLSPFSFFPTILSLNLR